MSKSAALMIDEKMASELLFMCDVCFGESMSFSGAVLAFLREHFPDVTQSCSYLPTKEEFAVRDKKISDAQWLWS